ncbi:MAG TPA: PKD domain-containing protein [Flavobacteriales bacterium]|nr:PKD domain-containing protein [Flavobacteriales bacterium]
MKLTRYLIILTLLFLIQVSSIWAQTYIKGVDAEKMINGSSKILVNEKLKTPQFIDLKIPVQQDPTTWLKTALQLPATDDFRPIDTIKADKLGWIRYKYQQYHEGYEVELGQYSVFVQQDKIIRAAGAFLMPIEISKASILDASQCLNSATQQLESEGIKIENLTGNTSFEEKPKIVLDKGIYHLCYEFEFYSIEPVSKKGVLVDVHTGQVIQVRDRIICTDVVGTANTMYYGTKSITANMVSAGNYQLKDNGRGITTWDLNGSSSSSSAVYFTNTTNNWTSTVNQDDAAYTCHWALEGTYDYYFNTQALDSYDDLGAEINAYVHYSTSYTNAFWDGSGLYFGDGGTGYDPLTSVDIVAHEFTHAVTEYSAGLIYSYESGALNESYSDIFGVVVDYELNADANFLIGDVSSETGTPFRNMSDPNSTSQPDTYEGTYWNSSGSDNGGVHTNSQVMNYWFYLLCTGGSGTNDNGDSYSVSSIGMDAAGDIAYRTLTTYLTSGSEYLDARSMSILAAEDLFGECSNEVVQVTNAWHAVGLGENFANYVFAGISSSRNYACSIPATINFTSTSINASNYAWNFGDGGTSTLQNPAHIYTTPGLYTVTLIVTGTASCGGNSDTLTIPNYIQIDAIGSPIAPSCVTNNTNAQANYGIKHVGFAQIDFSSGDAIDDYKDYSCSAAATLVAGDAVQLNITSYGNEIKRAWIDYNNDGVFNETTESVMSSGLHLGLSHTIVNTPTTVPLNVPLRMRVASNTTTLTNACSNPSYGQTEDYSVRFVSSSIAPIADFIATQTIVNNGGSVGFIDLSVGGSTSWSWSFPGGSPSTSTLENPTIVYNTPGIYEVGLTVSNAFGSDSIVKTAYIEVTSYLNMCLTTSSTLETGTLYDSGGPYSYYSNSENCSLLLQPTCADSIVINVMSMLTSSSADFLQIYDGTSSSGTLIYNSTASFPTNEFYAASGTAFFVWTSNSSSNNVGFKINWTSILHDTDEVVTPIISIGDTLVLFNTPITFLNETIETYNYTSWDFGDGQSAIGEEVEHSYISSGVFTSTMYVHRCDTSYSVSRQITVSAPPQIDISPLSIDLDLNCSSDSIFSINVSNTGAGPLSWIINNSSFYNSNIRILALNYGADLSTEYPNTIAAISNNISNYTLIESNATTASIVAPLLSNVDVVLFPENESGTSTIYTNLAALMQEFVANGGTVIQCYSSDVAINSLGLFSVNNYTNLPTGNNLILNDPDNETCEGVAPSFTSPNATREYRITNSNYIPIVKRGELATSELSIAGYRNIGNGRAYIIGFDYFLNAVASDKLLANFVANNNLNQLPNWIQISTFEGNVNPGESQTVDLTISSDSLLEGSYNWNLVVFSNDSASTETTIPIQLNVIGQGVLSAAPGCIHLGEIPVNSSESAGFWLYNSGCDTVEISGYTFTPANFDFNNPPSSVLPNDSIWLSIHGYLSSPGPYTATIELLNNYTPFTICLDANGVLSGGLVYNADSIFTTIGSCSDSTTLSILATNYNSTAVHVEANILANSGGINKIGVFTYGVDLTQEWNNMANVINNGTLTNYTLSLSSATISSDIQSFVNGKNIIIIPEGETSMSSFYSTLGPILNSFVQQGGRVLICAQPNITYLSNLGLFSTSINTSLTTNTTCQVNLTSPYTTGMSADLLSPDLTKYLSLSDLNVQNIVTYNNLPIVASKSMGLGEIIYFGFDYYSFNNATNKLLINILQTETNINYNNITINPQTDTIPAGGQLEFLVTVSSDSLANGQYTIPIIFSNNQVPATIDTVTLVFTVSGAPCSNFTYSHNCINQYSFDNHTLNGSNNTIWNFGDGVQSNSFNALHTYTSAGTYQVKLIVCNDIGCDTSIQSIVVTNDDVLLAPSCITNNTYSYDSYGISNLTLGSINNTSLGGIEDYVDYSCSFSTVLTVGDYIPFNIQCFNTEHAALWIDFNNNGIFENTSSERYYSSSIGLTNHQASFQVPSTAVLNTKLRMRVSSDYYSISGPCYNPYYGQTEDYSVKIVSPSSPPIADFIATPLIASIGQTINFYNYTTGGATSYEWIFESANTSTSNLINPTNTYSTDGVFNVTLIATNQFGSDTITKVAYITIINEYNLCGSVSSSNQATGIIYDSGGSSSYYANNENCSFLINRSCEESIILTVNSFNTQLNYDILRIYDGTSNAGELLWEASGNQSSISFTANSGKMFIEWVSNASSTFPGFKLTWATNPLIFSQTNAGFTVSEINPAYLEEIQFTDTSSSNTNSWLWQFGDGNSSTEQNPTHTYSESGTFEVILIASNCLYSDTASFLIQVQDAPEMYIQSNEINLYIGCNQESSEQIHIQNNGTGDLFWTIQYPASTDSLKILALTNGADLVEEYANTISAINETFTNYVLTENASNQASVIGGIINNYDIVLLPETNVGSVLYANLGTTLLNYVTNGGTVIKCGPTSMNDLDATQLFDASSYNYTNTQQITVNTASELLSDYPSTFQAANSTTFCTIANTDKVTLLSIGSSDVMSYRDIGQGRAYWIGFDYYATNTYASLALSRAVQINNNSENYSLPDWLISIDSSGIISPGNSQNVSFSVDTSILEDGFYTTQIILFSNDPLVPADTITINVYKNVQPCPSFTYVNSCGGEIVLQNTSNNANEINWIVEGLGTYTGETLDLFFAVAGTYTVYLEACNNFTCLVDSQTIDITLTSPLVNLNCALNEPSTCCNSTVVNLNSVSNTYLNNITINAQTHYKDMSCSEFIYMLKGNQSLLDVDFNNMAYYDIYIDFNNDLNFSSDELITSGLNNSVYYGFEVPQNAVNSQALRMRIILDDNAPIANECSIPEGGSVVDFAVIILDPDNLPLSQFSILNTNCSNEISFTNNSLFADTFHWDFGDGDTSNVENPTHVFSESGTYTVSLTSSGNGNYDTQTEILSVFNFNDTITLDGIIWTNELIQFQLSEEYDSYSWDFGTGISSIDPSPYFSYDSSGIYTCFVTVFKGDCFHTFSLTFEVDVNSSDLPVAIFNSINPDCGYTAYFLNTSINGDTYFWSFGDGTQSTELNPEHAYTNPGTYQVSLTTSNAWGDSVYISTVEIYPIEDEIIVTGSPFVNMPLVFSLSGTYDTYYWLFEGTYVTGANHPSHTFTEQGVYMTSVTVTLNGCEETFYHSSTILVTGIETNYLSETAVLYPNPTSSAALLRMVQIEDSLPSVELFDITGKLISVCKPKSVDGKKLEYLIEPQASGVYLVKVKTQLNDSIFRLIKTN